MKTSNLTQISLRNDPINRRMHGFSFRVSEDEVWCSRWEFSFLFWLNYDFTHSMGAEMSCEHKEINGTRNGEVHTENLMKNREPFFRREELHLKRTKSNHSRPMKRCIMIYGHDRAPFGWIVVLINTRLIVIVWLRCVLILWRRGCVALISRWILIQRSWLIGESTDFE